MSRLTIRNGVPAESLGFVSGPKSGPPGPLSGEDCYTGPAIKTNGSHIHKSCCSSCEEGGPCATDGFFTEGVGSLVMLGLAAFGGFCLWKRFQ